MLLGLGNWQIVYLVTRDNRRDELVPPLPFRTKWQCLGGEQLVDLIERGDYFTTGDKLLKIIAAGQLIIFQKLFPKICGNPARKGSDARNVSSFFHRRFILAPVMPLRVSAYRMLLLRRINDVK